MLTSTSVSFPRAQVDPTLVPEWLKGSRKKDKEDEPALL